MFVAAALGRYGYHQSRRYLSDTSSTMRMKLIQRIVRLLVNVALCPGLARFRDAREAENMLALSVALTEGAAAAASTSHLISPSHLCTHLSMTTTPYPRILAMLAVISNKHGANIRSHSRLRKPHRLQLWRTIAHTSKHGTNALGLARAMLPLRESTFHLEAHSTYYALTYSIGVVLWCSRPAHQECALAAQHTRYMWHSGA